MKSPLSRSIVFFCGSTRPLFKPASPARWKRYFSAALADARQRGGLHPAAALLKELADFACRIGPHLCLQHEQRPPTTVDPPSRGGRTDPPPPGGPAPRGSWLEAFLGGLPQFLLGLVSGLPLLLTATGIAKENSAFSTALGIFAGLAVLTSVILYFRMGRPRWAAAWFFYWFIAFMILVSGFFQWVLPNLELDTIINGSVFLALCCLALAFVLYHITVRDRLRGILAAVPATDGAVDHQP